MLMNSLVCIHNDTSSIYSEYPSYSSSSFFCPSRWAIPLGEYQQTLLYFQAKSIRRFLFRFHARCRPLTDLHDSILCQLVDSIHSSLFIRYWNRFEFEKNIFRLLPVFEDGTTKCCCCCCCCYNLKTTEAKLNRQRNADIWNRVKTYGIRHSKISGMCVNFRPKHPI